MVPRQRPDSQYAAAVPIFIRRLLENKPITIFGDGGQTRDLIFVGDVVRANLIAAAHPSAPGQVFNICTGLETRIIDLIEVLQDLFPSAPASRNLPTRVQEIFTAPLAVRKKPPICLVSVPKSRWLKVWRQTVEWMKNA